MKHKEKKTEEEYKQQIKKFLTEVKGVNNTLYNFIGENALKVGVMK